MPRPTPPPRSGPGQVAMQVARGRSRHSRPDVERDGGGSAAGPDDEARPVATSSVGRHRTPDTGALPRPGGAADVAPTRGPSQRSLERVEAARLAAERPAGRTSTASPPPARRSAPAARPAARRTAGPTDAETARPTMRPATRPTDRPAAGRSPITGAAAGRNATTPAADPDTTARRADPDRTPGHVTPEAGGPADGEEAVTDLVDARPARRGRAALPHGPGDSPVPGVLGLVVGVVALVAAVVAALAGGVVLPAVGTLGESRVVLLGALALALLGAGASALGIGRTRRSRPVALTGLVVSLAAVVAVLFPLLALATL